MGCIFDPYYADPQAQKAAKALSTLVNVSGHRAGADLAELIVRNHRTLQQAVMREVIVPLLDLWADQHRKGQYDDRNAGTVRAAVLLSEAFHNSNIGLPFI